MYTNKNEDELAAIREEIDAIDLKIQSLLNQRAQCAAHVAEVKLKNSLEDPDLKNKAYLFYRPEREAQLLRKIADRNDGLLKDGSVIHVFREIMSACLALENPLQVSYLGPEGTFSQAAAWKHFGHAAICKPLSSIQEVFAEVGSGRTHFGVVPVENSTEGMVSHTLDNLIDSPLKIVGEVEVRIEHHLLVSSQTEEADISKICAHEQGLAQCRKWLDSNWSSVERQAVASNGVAAMLAAEGDGVAAIAGEAAERQYNLKRISSNIEDFGDNTTRFLIVGLDDVPQSGDDKTSILISSRNRPGALFRILDPFQKAGISLTRIDTRPSRTEKWTYVFFIEFEGHFVDENVRKIFQQLEEHSVSLKVLGSYPRAWGG